jgi:hypothetical protein
MTKVTSLTAGPDGALWFLVKGANAVGRIDPHALRDRPQSPVVWLASGPGTDLKVLAAGILLDATVIRTQLVPAVVGKGTS